MRADTHRLLGPIVVPGRKASRAVTIIPRSIPYPYRAMLAICSDLDGTPDARSYLELMRFLNTTDTTCFGPGVGLEVGNSIYFYKPPNQFSYWNADPRARAALRALMRSGHVDCLHSFGNSARTRKVAALALEELQRHGCFLKVWVDHARVPTNLGRDIMSGEGDVPGSRAYHADLTCAYGIRYAWMGQLTSVIGQDTPIRLRHLFDPAHPAASVRTAGKEVAKRVLATLGSRRYRMHRHNRLLSPARLRDGRRIYEFIRCNPAPQGVGACATGLEIDRVVTPRFLAALSASRGLCILYTHLGKGLSVCNAQAFPARTFHRLAEAQRRGDILVTTTRRLLDYALVRARLRYRWQVCGRVVRICICLKGEVRIGSEIEPEALDGLTFYIPRGYTAQLCIGDRLLQGARHNAPDDTGRPSIMIPWRRLTFPL